MDDERGMMTEMSWEVDEEVNRDKNGENGANWALKPGDVLQARGDVGVPTFCGYTYIAYTTVHCQMYSYFYVVVCGVVWTNADSYSLSAIGDWNHVLWHITICVLEPRMIDNIVILTHFGDIWPSG